jgi:hypothetical protein
MDEIHALIHPPQPSAPEIIVLEQGTGRLGYSDFDPALTARPASLILTENFDWRAECCRRTLSATS